MAGFENAMSAMRRRAAIVLLGLVGAAAALALLWAPAAEAATCSVHWTNSVDGAWTDAANWSTAVVPGPADDVCIDIAGTYEVTLTGSASVRSLTVGGGAGAQTLALLGTSSSGATLQLASASTIQGTGIIELDSTSRDQLTVNLSGPGPVLNHGTLAFRRGSGGRRALSSTFTNASDGTVQAEAESSIFAGATVVNDGSVTVTAGSVLTALGASFTSNPGSSVAVNGHFVGHATTFTQAGGAVSGGAVVLNAGSTLADSAGTGHFVLQGTNTLLGTIPEGQWVIVEGRSSDDSGVEMPGPVTNNGTLSVDSSNGTAVLKGAGTLTNNAVVFTRNGLSAFPRLEVNLTNAAGGLIEIAGSTVLGGSRDPTTATNNGTVRVTPTGLLYIYRTTFHSNPGSTLDLGHGGSALAVTATFVQAGGAVVGNPLILRDGSTLDDSAGPGAFLFESSDEPHVLRGTIPTGQLVTVAGNTPGSAHVTLAGPSVVNEGHLIVTGSSHVKLDGSPLVNNGMLAVPKAAGGGVGGHLLRVPITNNGLFIADTQIVLDGPTHVMNHGRVVLEDGGSLLFVGGSFTNAADGTLAVTVNANAPRPASPGVTVVTGNPVLTAVLGGTLEVATIGTPAVGTSYTPITASSRVGTFAKVTFGSVPYEVTYSPTTVGLVVSPPRARFVPVTPERILDTRTGNGTAAGRLGAGGTVSLMVAGRGGVPASGASAVALTVTGVDSSPGFVTVWPGATPKPGTSNLNTTRPGQTLAVQVVVPVGADGTVSLSTSGGGHLLADVAGWYEAATTATAGRFSAVSPSRLLDTRNGTGAPSGRRPAGATVTLPVAGRGSVPVSGASAVVLSVTGVESSPGFVTAWPSGQTLPNASNLNTDFGGQTVAAHVIVPLGAGGNVELYTSGGGHLVVDVVGWFTDATAADSTSGLYVALTPQRRIDSRLGLGVSPAGRRPAGSTTGILLGGSGGIPATGAGAVVANVTAVQADPTFLTAWAGGSPRPVASNLNVTLPGDTVPNLVTSPVGTTAFLNLYTQAATHLLVDTFGYYLA